MPRPLSEDTIQVGPVRIRPAGDRYRLRWVEGGKDRERKVASLAEAQKEALDIAMRLNDPGTHLASTSTVSSLIMRAIDPADRPSWSKRYINTLHCDVRNHISPAIGDIECGKLTRRHCADILNTMAAEGYSTHTVSRVRKALKKIVREGILLGIWAAGTDPMEGVRLPAALGEVELDAVPPESVPTDEQAAALCLALTADEQRYGVVGNIARYTGMRYSEIMGLQAADVDLEKRELVVRRQRHVDPETGAWVVAPPKTRNSRRVVVVDRELVPVLRDWIESQALTDTAFLISTANGTGISPSNWADVMKRAREASGYPENLATHSLRHYAATRWLRLGAHVADVSRMLGHSSAALTMRLYVSGDAESIVRMKGLV